MNSIEKKGELEHDRNTAEFPDWDAVKTTKQNILKHCK